MATESEQAPKGTEGRKGKEGPPSSDVIYHEGEKVSLADLRRNPLFRKGTAQTKH